MCPLKNRINHVDKVFLYSDGACSGNPGVGGWGVILKSGEHDKELSGGEGDTTNNRMELTAILEGLKALKTPCDVLITTDSTYVKDGMTKWIKGWQRNNWRTAAKKPVKNKDIWLNLLDAAKPHTLSWEWVKGHNDHPENERCDALATGWVEEYKLTHHF